MESKEGLRVQWWGRQADKNAGPTECTDLPGKSRAPSHKVIGMRIRGCWIAALFLAALIANTTSASPAIALTAGNTLFEQTPTIGEVCMFDFGDAKGAYSVLTGYNAAHVYQTPGDYTFTLKRTGKPPITQAIHVLPDQRTVVRVKATDNLAAVMRGVRNNCLVLLPAGATFSVAKPVEIKSRNVEFRADGAGPAPRIVRTGVYTSTIYAQGIGLTFRGLSFDSDRLLATWGERKVAYRAINADGPHVSIIGCEFHNVDDAIFCTDHTRGVLVQWSVFTNEVRSCDVWCYGRNVVLLGNKMATSQQEHNVRSSAVGFTNLLLYQNDLTSTQGKETLTFRVGQDLYASHNAFHKGWIRTGPGPRPDRAMTARELATAFVSHVVLIDNALTEGAWLQINEGSSDVTARYNRFDSSEKTVPVHLDGPSLKDIRVEENYRVLKGTPTQKPFVRADRIEKGDLKTRGNRTKLNEEAAAEVDKDQ
ncbi:MAG TPA: hypothetical protein VFC78_13420 [Tepidisphaeraceae bacterium]|nr:hypothetical protein [Tepidisphaeraceae bacterium]